MDLHFEEFGSGQALFCLHGGMGLDHNLFLPWFERLGPHARVILFDFSGNGRSSPGIAPERMSHGAWVEDVERLRAKLGIDRIALLGHSYGGYLAQEYVLRHPDRVSKLILCNTAPVVDFVPTVIAKAQARGTLLQANVTVRMLTMPVRDEDEMKDAFRTLLPLYFHEWDPTAGRALLEGVRYRADAFNVGNGRELPDFDTRSALPALDVPTLVISGADDWIVPEEHGGRRLTELIPGARHVVFKYSGHFPYVEETDRFVAAVADFLEEDMT